ncbi:MAG: M48 family metallopeptidase [Prevotellaceae bacterium]|jgi:heat shock protein HtpX|nr:M48 family metallopeptidase [Prevotellaceae bacterium]
MKYVGIHTQQAENNARSVLLLFLFPCLIVALVYAFCYGMIYMNTPDGGVHPSEPSVTVQANAMFIEAVPVALLVVGIWFVIAYFANTSIINAATSSHSLSRMENKRIYNLVENLCMSVGMPMPKLQIIEDNSLNAFASGINRRTFTVTLSRGIIDKLNDEELQGVIAHELTHIRNRDVRLMIVSIVFVGIFSMIAEIALRSVFYTPRRRDEKGGGGVVILLAFVLAIVGFFFASLMRFAISRKREYMADAGAAEMTKNPRALASALRKISGDPDIEAVTRDDVAQLFIEHPGKQAQGIFGGLQGLFATHPPIAKRIAVLEQF